MASGVPPRRQAALKAEELNRAELERGMAEEEGEEEDSDYESEEDAEPKAGSKKRRRIDYAGERAGSGPVWTESTRQRAAELFSKLVPKISEKSKQVVIALLKEDRDEDPEDPIKKRLKLESFVDPMLTAYVSNPRAVPPMEEALQVARAVMTTFGTATVQQKVKFAGQEMEVQKKVDKTKLLEEQQATQSSLDTYIQGISKKQGITTVEKSSYDWEKYKEQQNLTEELQDASKAGFVEKQAFLSRVDERQFEKERAARERERAIREASQPQRQSAD